MQRIKLDICDQDKWLIEVKDKIYQEVKDKVESEVREDLMVGLGAGGSTHPKKKDQSQSADMLQKSTRKVQGSMDRKK